MLLNHFAGSNLGRFLEWNRLLEPRRRNHAGTIFVLISLCSIHGIANAVNETNVYFQSFRNMKAHRLVRDELRLSRHNRSARRALRKLIYCADTVSLTRNVGKHDRFHEPLDEGRFACPDRTDDAEVDVSAGTFSDVL